MLLEGVDEEGRNWNLVPPYVLFAVREILHDSTEITLFELLFGQRLRGLLEVAKET